MKKGIVLATCLLFLAFPVAAFAGDTFIFTPPPDKPGLDGVDSYVISGDGGSKVIHVMSLEPVAKDSYLVVGPDGESNVVIKFD
jgi:hypothetical protein